MDFLILTPATPPPPSPVPRYQLLGLGGGVKTCLAYGRYYASIRTQDPFHFFYMDPLTYGGVPGATSIFPRSAPILQSSIRSISIMAPHGFILTPIVTK